MPASREVKPGHTVLYWLEGSTLRWGLASQVLNDCTVLLTDGRVVDPTKCESRLEDVIGRIRKLVRKEKHG